MSLPKCKNSITEILFYTVHGYGLSKYHLSHIVDPQMFAEYTNQIFISTFQSRLLNFCYHEQPLTIKCFMINDGRGSRFSCCFLSGCFLSGGRFLKRAGQCAGSTSTEINKQKRTKLPADGHSWRISLFSPLHFSSMLQQSKAELLVVLFLGRSVGDWTQGLTHVRQLLHHWVTYPQVQKVKTSVYQTPCAMYYFYTTCASSTNPHQKVKPSIFPNLQKRKSRTL